MKKLFSRLGASCLLALLLVMGANSPVSAQASDFQLSPPKIQLTANPGDKKQVQISLKNLTAAQATATVSIYDFTSSGNESGEPTIQLDNSNLPTSIKKWLSGPASLPVASQGTAAYTATLTVPSTAKPGAYYGLVRFQKAGDPATVAVSSSVATVVLVNVGNVTETVAIEQFDTSGVRVDENGMLKGTLAARLKAAGNGYTIPTAKVEIVDHDRVVQTVDLNTAQGGVLPGTIRKFTGDLELLKAAKGLQARLVVTAKNNPAPLTTTENLPEPPQPATQPTPAATKPAKKTSLLLPVTAAASLFVILIATVLFLVLKKRKKPKLLPTQPTVMSPTQPMPKFTDQSQPPISPYQQPPASSERK